MIPGRSKLFIADDYGLHASINSAIEDLILEGKVSAVSVMVELVNSDEAKKLAEICKEKNIQLGLHWNVTEPLKLNHMGQHLNSQWQRFYFLFGFYPKYVDSHHHIHQWPFFSQIFFKGLKSFEKSDIWVRSTRLSPIFFKSVFFKLSIKSQIKCFISHLLGVWFHTQAKKAGFECNKGAWGIYDFKRSNDFNIQLLNYLNTQPDSEIFIVHPGREDSLVSIGQSRFHEYKKLKFNTD
jgi:hypothetical protein